MILIIIFFCFHRYCHHGYYQDGRSSHYCRESCSEITKCGPVIIPERHLKVCYNNLLFSVHNFSIYIALS